MSLETEVSSSVLNMNNVKSDSRWYTMVHITLDPFFVFLFLSDGQFYMVDTYFL